MKKIAFLACSLIVAYGAQAQSANDAGVSGITSPASQVMQNTSIPVSVTFKNYGTSPLTAATLGFSVDGVMKPTYSWIGNLATNASSTVNLGNVTLPAGNHIVKAWTTLPNGATDGNAANDTTIINITARTALNGSYTVNKNLPASATNFTSLTDVATSLNTMGITGPVTITVAPGTGPYNEQLVLNAISGATATNTITFEGNGNTISGTPDATNRGVVTLYGADYVKINNFVITLPTGVTSGWGVQLTIGANYNILSNNTINLPSVTTDVVNGIIAGATSTTPGSAHNNLIVNNVIDGGFHGIRLNGGASNNANNQIVGNQIKNFNNYGVYLSSNENTLISGNDISRPNYTGYSQYNGIYINGNYNKTITITKNRFHRPWASVPAYGFGAYGVYFQNNDAPVGSENVVKNNLFYDFNTNGNISALYNFGSDGVHFLHNTVVLDFATNNSQSRGINQSSTVTNVKVMNNIFTLSGALGTKHALYFSSTSGLTSNGNVFHIQNGNVGYNGTDVPTLAAWKTANGNAYDQNSVAADPLYLSPLTGNYKPGSSSVDNMGQSGSGVTDDITGATRSITTPDAGAYEFVPATSDAGISAVLSPNSGCGLSGQETVSVTVNNYGNTAKSNIPVAYRINGGTLVTETFAGPLAAGASATYNFIAKANLSTPNTYTIVAKTLEPGDNMPANDSTVKIINALPIITLPYTESFENGNGGWLAGGGLSSWALGTPAKTVINSAAAGTKAWVTSLTGTYNPSENSYVVSPCFNFTGIPDPMFEMKAWWNSEYSKDGAVLQSSIDGGATWQNVGTYLDPTNWYNNNYITGGPGGQPIGSAVGWTGRPSTGNGSNGWVTVKHRLIGLGGQASVKFRIAFGADPLVMDDGFAFDAIRIIDDSNDLGVNAIMPNTKQCGFTAAEPVTVVLGNAGSSAVSGFNVTYKVDNGTPVTEPFTGSIGGGATANFTFNQTANLSAFGNHKIAITVNKAGDPNAVNDTATYKLVNSFFSALPPVFNFEPTGNGISQLNLVTNAKSAILDGAGASFGSASTKGMIMDGVDSTMWTTPSAAAPWTSNPDNFAAAYFCFSPGTGAATDSMYMTFDLKQLFKATYTNTNFRVTVNGTQVGPTYRPPFSGTPINWQKIKVDLSNYLNATSIQIGLESSVKEAYANGNGTANLIDNIQIKRVAGPATGTGIKDATLAAQLNVFPNPGNGLFNVELPKGKTYELVVTDLTGKVLKKQTANGGTSQLNLESTAKGIYLLKVTGEKGAAVRKLIVE